MNGKTEIWESVEEFRQKHLGDLGKVPVDVLTVIEVRLRLDVIPFDRLFEKYSVDAAVMPDFFRHLRRQAFLPVPRGPATLALQSAALLAGS